MIVAVIVPSNPPAITYEKYVNKDESSHKNDEYTLYENRPEEGCAQEVHVKVCSQLKDVQLEVRIRFDSKPKFFPILHIKR